MLSALRVYFEGEKQAGLLLAAVAAGIILTAIAMFRGGPGLRAFAVTLGVIALSEIALGVSLYLRTDPQVGALVQRLAADPAGFYAAEAGRMARVQRSFVVIEYVELILIVVSAIAAISLKTRPGITGVALGVLISASMLLAFDLIAERRGAEYVAAIGRQS